MWKGPLLALRVGVGEFGSAGVHDSFRLRLVEAAWWAWQHEERSRWKQGESGGFAEKALAGVWELVLRMG